MYKERQLRILLLMIILPFLVCACSTEKVNKKPIKLSISNSEQQKLKKFMYCFEVNHYNACAFKKLIDKYGIYAIKYGGMSPDRIVHIYKNDIKKDWALTNPKNHKMAFSLGSLEFYNDVKHEKPIVNSSSYLKNIRFDINWHKNDEKMIESKMINIYNTCKEIILQHNKGVPQVFILKNNYVAFTRSSVYKRQWLLSSCKKYKEQVIFDGDWAIFENVGGKYKLRAVIKFE